MKKKIFIIFISMFLMLGSFKAECTDSRYNELKGLAGDITYETSYSISSKTFTVTFYNVFPGMFLIIDKKAYAGNAVDNYSVVIKNVSEGEYIKADVEGSADCSNRTLNSIFITLPYYNSFFRTQKCEPYEEKLSLCSSRFLSYRLTEEILDDAIAQIDKKIDPVVEPETPKKTTFELIMDAAKDFFWSWGINIIVFVVFGAITALIGNKIFKKIKHGI